MKQKIYIVELKNGITSYYLTSLSGTCSKVIRDAVLFLDEFEAYKYASISEGLINNCVSQVSEEFLGKIIETSLIDISV